mgnify:CR=1 FL=1
MKTYTCDVNQKLRLIKCRAEETHLDIGHLISFIEDANSDDTELLWNLGGAIRKILNLREDIEKLETSIKTKYSK